MFQYKIFTSSYLNQNTTLLRKNGDAVVIDPGVFPTDMDIINQYLEENDLELKAILFTHTHGDHIAGWNYLPEVPLYAGSGLSLKTREQTQKDLSFIENIFRSNGHKATQEVLFPQKVILVENEEEIEVEDFTFQFFHVPGHSIDEAMIYSPDFDAIFPGDMLIKAPYPFILENAFQYRFSLSYMAKILSEKDVTLCIPGHYKEAHEEEIMKRVNRETAYLDEIWKFLLEIYSPGIPAREIEERLLHYDPKRIKVHFTHKMNVNRFVKDLKLILGQG